METTDANKIEEKPRKYSINALVDSEEFEKITYPPSTELIPDEYKHESESGLVLIFYGKADVLNKNLLKEALEDQKYYIPEENVIKLTKKEHILDFLWEFVKVDHSNKTCILVFFMGTSIGQDLILPDDEEEKHVKNAISIKDVWTPFTGDNCEFLRNKPKIFVFQSQERLNLIQFDSIPKSYFIPPKDVYKLPAEADMLVIYKKIEKASSKENFIEQFCNNLDEFGKKDDIIGIISRFEDKTDQRPLTISTLTRKFYVTSNSYRGHHLDFIANHDLLLDGIQKINSKIENLYEYRRKVRARNSMRRNLTVTDSPANSNSNEEVLNQNTQSKIKSSVRTTRSNTPITTRSNSVQERPPWRF